MNYDIKIIGEDTGNKLLEFDRLGLLIKSTKDIATKALMLRLRGFSEIAPDKELLKALSMKLQNVRSDDLEGTSLTIDCAHFSETLKGLQYDIFKPAEDILQLTPMALVIESFQAALTENTSDTGLDKPLLKSLMSFKKNFSNNNEVFLLANRGSVPEVRIIKEDFQKIHSLDESLPAPQKVVINGQLDEIKISKGKLGLICESGSVVLITREHTSIPQLLDFMGKDITIFGKAHYKSNGQLSFIEIQDFSKPGAQDKFFSKKPSVLTARQQLLFQEKEGIKPNTLQALKSLSGLLKEEISEEQFREMINDAHR